MHNTRNMMKLATQRKERERGKIYVNPPGVLHYPHALWDHLTVYSKPADIYATTSDTLSSLTKIPATLPTLTCQVVHMRNDEKDFWDAQYQKYDETYNPEKRERERERERGGKFDQTRQCSIAANA